MVEENDESDNDNLQPDHATNLYEWKLLSKMGATNQFSINELEILRRRDFVLNNRWKPIVVPHQLNDCAI